ncbi:MAG TPA: TonB family protein [Burkholderiales bacterium]|nr:TonB family protein [Burkholderiales bacterium]
MAAVSRARFPTDWRTAGRSSKWASIAIVVALHIALVAALLQFASVRTAIIAAAPIMTTLITPPKKVEPPPKPPPPPPRPQVRHKPTPAPQPPIIAAQPEAPPTTFTAPPPLPVPVPLPPIEAPVAPVAVAPPPAPPAPVIPPSFNAAYLNNPGPEYPLVSRQMGEEGRVILRVFVNENGLPEQVQVRTSSGFTRLDTTAQDTVRRWKFTPARRGDTPVGAWVLVPMTFKLGN